MLRASVMALMMLATSAALFPATSAHENLTIVYLEPDKPRNQSMFMVAEWPSFLFFPNAPLSVRYVDDGGRPILGRVGVYSSFVDLNCDSFSGPVDVRGGDPHGLDRDGDGIGCE